MKNTLYVLIQQEKALYHHWSNAHHLNLLYHTREDVFSRNEINGSITAVSPLAVRCFRDYSTLTASSSDLNYSNLLFSLWHWISRGPLTMKTKNKGDLSTVELEILEVLKKVFTKLLTYHKPFLTVFTFQFQYQKDLELYFLFNS